MRSSLTLDRLVRERLKEWPQRPPGMARGPLGPDAWLRGRPGREMHTHPFLKLPGSSRYRTLPDGLWFNFGGTPDDPYVDIFAIEACTTLQNLLDKRSRFAPSTHSLLAVCPVEWLLAPVIPEDPTPRWKVTGVIRSEPTSNFVVPVRDMHVLYGLKREHYATFARYQLPHAHEFFAPMEALTATDGAKNPELQAMLARASATANFMPLPPPPASIEQDPVDP
jgi:hypothetical protein